MKSRLIAAILLLLVPFTIYAAGTVTESYYVTGTTEKNNLMVQWYFFGDNPADTATSTALETILKQGWYLFMVTTVPSGPTDDYDVYVTDADGLDITGGRLANRDTANAEAIVPLVDSANSISGTRYVNTALTVSVSNQSNAAGAGYIKLYFAK